MLALIILASGHTVPPITMPAVQGMLVPKATAMSGERARPGTALPTPSPRSEPIAPPVPPVKAPPSERAITLPQPEPIPAKAHAATSVGNSAAPVVPVASPRGDSLSGGAAKIERTETRDDRVAAVQAGLLGQYLAVVKERVESHRDYPSFARQSGHQGTVMLRVRIAADGGIGSIAVAQSSGYGTLDRAAVAAVKRAAPFKAPAGFGLREVTVEVPIVYRLTAS